MDIKEKFCSNGLLRIKENWSFGNPVVNRKNMESFFILRISDAYTLEPETGLGIPRFVLLRIKPIMPPYLPASAFRTQIVFELMA